MPHDSFYPLIDANTLAFIRLSYGLLMLGHLLVSLPHGRRFFLSERWGGYCQSSWFVDHLQNPVTYPWIMSLWLASAACIAAGWWAPWTSLVNVVLCRYFFLQMRWRGVGRGMGAPGFIAGWLANAVFLLELCAHYAPSVQPLALLVLQVDFALIMFVAGWYKLNAGYFSGEGMEYGMVNPEWGHWWWAYRRLSTRSGFFAFNNHMAWMGEIVAGALMLFPPTRFWGALFILLSFVYIALNIRLLVLCEMVMVACVLFFATGTPGHAVIMVMVPALLPSSAPALTLPAATIMVLQWSLWVYLILLPWAYAGMFYNLYGHRALPRPVQLILERYTNLFGLILWRVFSADITNFFIRIYHQPMTGGARTLVSHWGLAGGLRYSHVAEAITVTSLFTTLKYYPSNNTLFRERLFRYARTISCPENSLLVFEYISIRKTNDRFVYVPVSEFEVDVAGCTVREQIIEADAPIRRPLTVSPVHQTGRPGSYAPLKT